MINKTTSFQAINTAQTAIPQQQKNESPIPAQLNFSASDSVNVAESSKGISATQINFTETDPYAKNLQEAGKLYVALAVLIDGGEDDIDQFENEYSDREFKGMIKHFQEQLGAEITGQWNEETYGLAKDLVIEEVLDGEYITDGQFDSFLKDLMNFYNGEITGKETLENLEAYAYDGYKHPVNRPIQSDPEGFNAFVANLSTLEQAQLAMGYEGFDMEEVNEMMAFINGSMPEDELKIVLKEDWLTEEEMAFVEQAPTLKDGLLRLTVAELQDDADIPEEEQTGVIDQKTFDALRELIREDFDLDISNEDLSKVTNEYLKFSLEAIKTGKVDDSDYMNNMEDKIFAPYIVD